MPQKKTSQLQHIALIMDGNRRWARAHKLQVIQGHAYVANRVIEALVDTCVEKKIKYLTLWAFSTENWNREQEEVSGLMQLFRTAFERNAKELHQKGVQLNAIGDLSKFPKDIQTEIQNWIEISRKNTKITVTFALNYGGRDEIIRAIRLASKQLGTLTTQISQDQFGQYLDTTHLPDPDLIIRPGGEKRLSGFLPWQATYAELYFSDVLMPDFGSEELLKAIDEYQERERRFGK